MKGKLPFLLIALLGIALDLGTKEIAFHHPQQHPGERIAVIHNDHFVLYWHQVENPGGMFGIGQGLGGVLKYARLLALGLVLYFFLKARSNSKLFLASLSLIFAGAVGNLYDSFFNDGKVRDFIEVYLNFMPEKIFGRLFQPWPTFNVADSMILIGACLLVIQLFLDPELGKKQPAGQAGKDESRDGVREGKA